MNINTARSGYVLPVFACAAAVAALRHLQGQLDDVSGVNIDLVEPPETVRIDIESVARLQPEIALAIARSDPGDNLDLTRHTPVWAMVEWNNDVDRDRISIVGGEGLGRDAKRDRLSISAYARRLILSNLERYLLTDKKITVTLILPEGRSLAKRTSNAAFGIVEGLSLLGTSAISQPLSAPDTLENYREILQEKAAQFKTIVFCIGENGLDLARKMGVPESRLVKIANWIGPLLVAAGNYGIESLLLFGYHGKLIKLAGGIFHTHHHLADARLEILTAYSANAGLDRDRLQHIFKCSTAEDGLQYLRGLDASPLWSDRVYRDIAEAIDRRCQDYIQKHSDRSVEVGSILFDRQRQIVVKSDRGTRLLSMNSEQ